MFFTAPELIVRSDWIRHEVRADLKGTYYSYAGYKDEPSLNRPFVDSKVAGRLDVTG